LKICGNINSEKRSSIIKGMEEETEEKPPITRYMDVIF
jgi:hypothetical protein